MREITAYLASDGSIYADESKCKTHEDDLLGAELDGLLRLFKLELTRTQEYKGLLCAMKSRSELLEAVRAIVKILEHGSEE